MEGAGPIGHRGGVGCIQEGKVVSVRGSFVMNRGINLDVMHFIIITLLLL